MNERSSIGVLTKEKGIIEKDGIHFHTFSQFAKDNLCYLLWGAKYTCNIHYGVRRKINCFDSLLFFYIEEGSMSFQYRTKHFIANKNDVILLNCNYPHEYKAVNNIKFYWFHFNGNIAKAYEEKLYQKYGAIFRHQSSKVFEYIMYILKQSSFSDDEVSITIQKIFLQLINSFNEQIHISAPILRAKLTIEENFQKELTVDELSSIANMSKFYFSRLFRQEVKISPYAYLLQIRLEYAKKLLSETNISIEQISEHCVFYSASNFIRIFRKYTNMTPLQFRKLFFYNK